MLSQTLDHTDFGCLCKAGSVSQFIERFGDSLECVNENKYDMDICTYLAL